MNDRTLMLLTSLASIICAIWACFVPAYAMAITMVLNAIVSVVLAFKLEK